MINLFEASSHGLNSCSKFMLERLHKTSEIFWDRLLRFSHTFYSINFKCFQCKRCVGGKASYTPITSGFADLSRMHVYSISMSHLYRSHFESTKKTFLINLVRDFETIFISCFFVLIVKGKHRMAAPTRKIESQERNLKEKKMGTKKSKSQPKQAWRKRRNWSKFHASKAFFFPRLQGCLSLRQVCVWLWMKINPPGFCHWWRTFFFIHFKCRPFSLWNKQTRKHFHLLRRGAFQDVLSNAPFRFLVLKLW